MDYLSILASETENGLISQIFTIGDLSKDVLTMFLAWLVWRETAKLNELKRELTELRKDFTILSKTLKEAFNLFLEKKPRIRRKK